MEGTSGEKPVQKKLWRLPIEMDGKIKRPYTPSIEVVTRPGEELPNGYRAPARLSVLLRSQTSLYYGVMGLRLPVGVERKEITCQWDEDEQTCILEAPYTGPAPVEGSHLVMMGMENSFNGNQMSRYDKYSGNNPARLYNVMFDSKASNFVSGAPTDMMAAVMGRDRQVQWSMNLIGVDDIVLPYEIVDIEADEEGAEKFPPKEPREYPEDFFDGDGGYERQYWFRNPIIKLSHYDGGPSNVEIFNSTNPYGRNPFE